MSHESVNTIHDIIQEDIAVEQDDGAINMSEGTAYRNAREKPNKVDLNNKNNKTVAE